MRGWRLRGFGGLPGYRASALCKTAHITQRALGLDAAAGLTGALTRLLLLLLLCSRPLPPSHPLLHRTQKEGNKRLFQRSDCLWLAPRKPACGCRGHGGLRARRRLICVCSGAALRPSSGAPDPSRPESTRVCWDTAPRHSCSQVQCQHSHLQHGRFQLEPNVLRLCSTTFHGEPFDWSLEFLQNDCDTLALLLTKSGRTVTANQPKHKFECARCPNGCEVASVCHPNTAGSGLS